MKTCNKCGEEKPATPEYFHRNKAKKDGLIYTCKECVKKEKQKYYQKNKEKRLEYGRKHYQENKEHYAEYYQENKEEKREYYQENKEEKREYSREYYQENKEHYTEYHAEYYQKNKEKYQEYAVIYYLENPEVYRLNEQRRRARMAQLPHTLTVEEWEETLEYFDYSCAYCGVPEDNLCQEHVIPVSKGGGYTADNIIPACGTCNSSKHTRNMEEWYVSYRHYDEGRLNKILDYIEIVKGVLYYY